MIKLKSNISSKYLICNIILKFMYIYLFWNLLLQLCAEINLFWDLSEYFYVFLIPAFFKFYFLIDDQCLAAGPLGLEGNTF